MKIDVIHCDQVRRRMKPVATIATLDPRGVATLFAKRRMARQADDIVGHFSENLLCRPSGLVDFFENSIGRIKDRLIDAASRWHRPRRTRNLGRRKRCVNSNL